MHKHLIYSIVLFLNNSKIVSKQRVVKMALLLCTLFFMHQSNAQERQAKKMFKNFISICSQYKYLPLQLELDYKKSSNLMITDNDSVSMKGFFNMHTNGAYIRFGAAEQLIEDSLVLIVLQDIKQMVIAKADVDVVKQLNTMISLPVKDSSIEVLVNQYDITQALLNKNVGMYSVMNKTFIPSTHTPFEQISMEYDIKKSEPIKIETIKRSLIKKENYLLSTDALVVTIENKGEYYIKEDKTTYLFSSVTHDASKKLTTTINQRIIKDDNLGFIPTKAYEQYKISIN